MFSTEKSDLIIKLTNRDIYVNCDHFMYFLVCKNKNVGPIFGLVLVTINSRNWDGGLEG